MLNLSSSISPWCSWVPLIQLINSRVVINIFLTDYRNPIKDSSRQSSTVNSLSMDLTKDSSGQSSEDNTLSRNLTNESSRQSSKVVSLSSPKSRRDCVPLSYWINTWAYWSKTRSNTTRRTYFYLSRHMVAIVRDLKQKMKNFILKIHFC